MNVRNVSNIRAGTHILDARFSIDIGVNIVRHVCLVIDLQPDSDGLRRRAFAPLTDAWELRWRANVVDDPHLTVLIHRSCASSHHPLIMDPAKIWAHHPSSQPGEKDVYTNYETSVEAVDGATDAATQKHMKAIHSAGCYKFPPTPTPSPLPTLQPPLPMPQPTPLPTAQPTALPAGQPAPAVQPAPAEQPAPITAKAQPTAAAGVYDLIAAQQNAAQVAAEVLREREEDEKEKNQGAANKRKAAGLGKENSAISEQPPALRRSQRKHGRGDG